MQCKFELKESKSSKFSFLSFSRISFDKFSTFGTHFNYLGGFAKTGTEILLKLKRKHIFFDNIKVFISFAFQVCENVTKVHNVLDNTDVIQCAFPRVVDHSINMRTNLFSHWNLNLFSLYELYKMVLQVSIQSTIHIIFIHFTLCFLLLSKILSKHTEYAEGNLKIKKKSVQNWCVFQAFDKSCVWVFQFHWKLFNEIS